MSDVAAMARLHAAGFDRGWPKTEMERHIAADLCLGVGQPLAGFIIIRCASDQAEVLTVTVDKALRQGGFGRALA